MSSRPRERSSPHAVIPTEGAKLSSRCHPDRGNEAALTLSSRPRERSSPHVVIPTEGAKRASGGIYGGAAYESTFSDHSYPSASSGRFVFKEYRVISLGFELDEHGRAVKAIMYQPDGVYEAPRVQ